MTEEIISEYYTDEQQPTCADRDWECMYQNFYDGYVLLVEAVVQVGTDEEGNPITEVYSVDVTGFTNQEIEDVINNIKELYPDAVEVRVHFCGNHIGKPCEVYKV